MTSTVVKRSIVIAGHKTSLSVEDPFWNAMREIAKERGLTMSQLVGLIDMDRREGNLSSTIRLFVLAVFRERLEGRKDGERLVELAG